MLIAKRTVNDANASHDPPHSATHPDSLAESIDLIIYKKLPRHLLHNYYNGASSNYEEDLSSAAALHFGMS